jgi:predicted molibdopterin-dependent oxidoreductase YjgC
MPAEIEITVNGRKLRVPEATRVWAAVTRAGFCHAHRSPTGQARGALCGIGICFECRVTIDGVPNQRSCQLECTPGMRITIDE